MIARKRKKVIIISSIIAVIFIIIGICVALYFTTDSFKSNKTLFGKYISKNIGNFNSLLEITKDEEYRSKTDFNKYTSAVDMKANYIENYETTSEDSSNSINKLKLNIVGKTDKSNNYNYQEINLYNEAEEVIKAEYINDNEQYGIRVKDVSDKFIISKESNFKDVFKALGGYNEQIFDLVLNLIDSRLIENIDLTESEKEKLENRYLSILNDNISKEKFNKLTNQSVSIEGHSYNTTAYTLTLTTEELNNLYIKLLEEMKNDDIIISKLEKIEPVITIMSKEDSNKEIKERISELIDNKIDEIKRNNIGQEETTITVYNYNKETIKTSIKTRNVEISFECLNLKDNIYVGINRKDLKEDKEMTMAFKEQGTNLKININNESNNEKDTYSMELERNINLGDKELKKEYKIGLESNKKNLEFGYEENIQLVDSFENQVHLEENNSRDLREVENEEYNKITEAANNKVNKLNETVKSDDIVKVLVFSKLIDEELVIKDVGVTENEKNRFNSRIELFVGEDIEGKKIAELVNIIKDNLVNITVEDKKIIKLELKQNEKDEIKAEKITGYINSNLNDKYDVSLEYDDETGLVKIVSLTIKKD